MYRCEKSLLRPQQALLAVGGVDIQEARITNLPSPTAGERFRTLLSFGEQTRHSKLLILGDQQIAWRLQWIENLTQRTDEE